MADCTKCGFVRRTDPMGACAEHDLRPTGDGSASDAFRAAREQAPRGEPILITCEGSGHPPAGAHVGRLARYGICAMCGTDRFLEDDGTMPTHQRDDVLARIDRGDFD